MYEDNPDDPLIPQEMLQLEMYEALEEVTRHFTHGDVQQGNSAHANNGEDVTESHDEMNENGVENSLICLNDADTIDQMSAFFDDAYWAGVSFDGATELIASSGTEIGDQQSSDECDLPLTDEQVMDGLDLSDYGTLVAFNHQFDLDGQTDLNQQVNLDDQVNVNQQANADQQVDLNHEADLDYPVDLGPQLEKPIVPVEGQSEQEEVIDLDTTNLPVSRPYIPDGSPYAPATDRGEHGLGSNHLKQEVQKKKARVRNTVAETSEPTRSPTRSLQQYAGVRKAKSPKGKIIGAAALDHMEKLTNHPDPPACAAEQALVVQGPVDERLDITLAHFLTEEALDQIKSTAKEIAREEAKRVYSREINSSLSKAYAQHLESKLRQQQLLLQEAYSGGPGLQHRGSQMMETQSLMGQDVSFNTPGLPQSSYGPSAQGNQPNAYPSPQNTVMVVPNSSQSAGQPASHMSPTNGHHVFQAPAMLPMNGFSFLQQNGHVTGLNFAQQHSQMNGFGLMQSAPQFVQQGHQSQIQLGQQIQTQQSPQVSQQQQVYYPNLQPQPQQPVQYYTALAAPQQPTYQPQSQAQVVAQQYRAQQHRNQMLQQQGHQMQQVQPNQQAARAQRGRRVKQRQSIQQAQQARESHHGQQVQPLQQTSMYYQPNAQPSNRSSNTMPASQSAFTLGEDDLQAPQN